MHFCRFDDLNVESCTCINDIKCPGVELLLVPDSSVCDKNTSRKLHFTVHLTNFHQPKQPPITMTHIFSGHFGGRQRHHGGQDAALPGVDALAVPLLAGAAGAASDDGRRGRRGPGAAARRGARGGLRRRARLLER